MEEFENQENSSTSLHTTPMTLTNQVAHYETVELLSQQSNLFRWEVNQEKQNFVKTKCSGRKTKLSASLEFGVKI